MTAAVPTTAPAQLAPVMSGSRFDFEVATPTANAELLQFTAAAEMPGAMRFGFDRAPDYFAALRVEGRHTEVLIGREAKTGRLIATGQRSVKNAYVNGVPTLVSYLSGLRVEPSARSAAFLTRGYARLKALQARHPAQYHLTTVMEDNSSAKKVLLSKQLGLPRYTDLGRFCCMALSLRVKVKAGSQLSIRRAGADDAIRIVDFLNHEGPARQFFPEYRVDDFGNPNGLLSHLAWRDVWLAFDGPALLGVLATWDQKGFRRWRVTGYAPWLRWSRHLLNLGARLRRMPLLPPIGAALNCFNLGLICIRDNNCDVFNALLDEILQVHRNHYACFLAGLHERDPLVPELQNRPHVPLTSRLYRVDWDHESPAGNLDGRIPYLELGSL